MTEGQRQAANKIEAWLRIKINNPGQTGGNEVVRGDRIMTNKKTVSNQVEQRIEPFYIVFRKSKLYHLSIFLVIFIGILFIPTGKFIADLFKGGPFIAGPYIMLILMLIIFTLYINKILYLFSITLFIFSSLISFIGIAMGSLYVNEVLFFFLPIFVFLIINIFIAKFTYKYKQKIYSLSKK